MAKYIVQHRRGTAAQWADKNTIIPKEGELVIEIDEASSLHKLKIGDGIHTYAELAYLQAGDEIVTQVLAKAMPRVVTIELTSTWTKDADEKYSQVLTLDGITEHSRLDLQPTADMLAEFKQLGLVFVTENNGGTITVYSVGNMPLKAYTMQATIIETECDGEDTAVVGIPVGSPAVTSWDELKDKPVLGALSALDEVGKDLIPSDVAYINVEDNETIEETKEPVIDVVAEVGQTIVVEEVDADGKPTKWKAAEYQPRTHGKEVAELLPNTNTTLDEELGGFMVEFAHEFEVGNSYTINWNGTSYTCVAFKAVEMDGLVGVGNVSLMAGTGDTGEPFVCFTDKGLLLVLPLDGSTELTIGVSGEIFQKIDKNYLPDDVMYGEPVYGKSLVDFERWCSEVAGIENITYITNYGVSPDEAWINVGGTREHFGKMVELAANQLLFLSSASTIATSSVYDGVVQILFQKIGHNGTNIKYEKFTLKFRWSDTDNCVQRVCFDTLSAEG